MNKNRGSVLLITIFVIALLSSLVAGLLSISTEEIVIMENYLGTTEAQMIAEAGLNDCFAQLRNDSSWTAGFSNKSFDTGSYSASVTGTLPALIVEATGTADSGHRVKVSAEVTVTEASPCVIRIDRFGINE